MQTIQIIVFVLAVLLVIFIYAASWQGLNARCLDRHSYQPLNGGTIFFTTVTFVCLWIGSVMILDDHTGKGVRLDLSDSHLFSKIIAHPLDYLPPFPWSQEFLHSEQFNGVIVGSIGILAGLGTLIWIWTKTSFLATVGCSILLSIAGSLVILLIVLMLLLLYASAQGSRRKVYVEE